MEVLQLDNPLEAGLQVAILFEHPLILGADGLLDSGDLAADFVVEFGGVGISRPVGEHRLRPAPLVRCPDDDHDFDPAAAIPKRLPEFTVRGTPGAERRRGLVARIDVDEHGALGVKRDGEPEREAGISVRKSLWDKDLATPCERRVSHGVSEGRKSCYPLGFCGAAGDRGQVRAISLSPKARGRRVHCSVEYPAHSRRRDRCDDPAAYRAAIAN